MANENETHEEVCAEMRSFGNVPPPMFAWRDLAERAEAAHKRELAAKDEEIEDLKTKNNEAFKAVLEREMIIRDFSQRAILDLPKGCCMDCDECKNQGDCFPNDQTMVRLVAKAREALGENRVASGAAQDWEVAK